MKKIFGIALIMTVLAGGVTVNAQTQATPKKDKTEQCDKDRKCDGKDKKDKKDCKRKNHKKGQRADLFAGITLTPEQKTQLDALKAERKALRHSQKEQKEQATKKDRQARHAEFDAKVKGILTPEQWAIYQKNVENMKYNRQKKNA